MSVRVKHGRWEYRFVIGGHVVRESTGLAAIGRGGKEINRSKAEELELQHRMGILEGRLGVKRLTVRSFSEAVEEWRTVVELERKSSSGHRIMTSMVSAKVYFGDTAVSLIDVGDVDGYKVWRLKEHQVKPVTVKHDLDALSLFFQWAAKKKYARINPVREVDKPSDADAKREHILSNMEERLYFAEAAKHPTLHDFGRVMLNQGMRPEEVERICYEIPRGKVALVDGVPRYTLADMDDRRLKIVSGKTAKSSRVLPMTDEIFAILAHRRGDSVWAFPSPVRPGHHITKLNTTHDRVLENINLCRTCGHPERSHQKGERTKGTPGPRKPGCEQYVPPERMISFVMYDLRHTAATRFVRAGISILQVAKILGHSSVKITERYVHLAQEDIDRAMTTYKEVLASGEPRVRPS